MVAQHKAYLHFIIGHDGFVRRRIIGNHPQSCHIIPPPSDDQLHQAGKLTKNDSPQQNRSQNPPPTRPEVNPLRQGCAHKIHKRQADQKVAEVEIGRVGGCQRESGEDKDGPREKYARGEIGKAAERQGSGQGGEARQGDWPLTGPGARDAERIAEEMRQNMRERVFRATGNDHQPQEEEPIQRGRDQRQTEPERGSAEDPQPAPAPRPTIDEEIHAERGQDDERCSMGKHRAEAEQPKDGNVPDRTTIGLRGNNQPGSEQTGQRWSITTGFARVEHERERGDGQEEWHPGEFFRESPRGEPDQHQHNKAREHRERAVDPRVTVLAGQQQPQRVERVVVVVAVKLEDVPRMLRRARPLQREQLVKPKRAAPGGDNECGADQKKSGYNKPSVHGAASNCRR